MTSALAAMLDPDYALAPIYIRKTTVSSLFQRFKYNSITHVSFERDLECNGKFSFLRFVKLCGQQMTILMPA